MSKELLVQTNIIKSVRKDGGYARKMSNRFLIGIPDLVLGLYPFGVCFAEVKDLGECGRTFNRKIPVTEKQRHELNLIDAAYKKTNLIYTPYQHVAFVLVAFKHQGKHMLVAANRNIESLTHHFDSFYPWVDRQVGGYYDMGRLMQDERVGIIKVEH